MAGWVLFPALLAAGLLPVLLAPVLPLIDLYNHVFRFDVLSRLGGDPLLAANYTAAWALLPNIGLDVIAAGLLTVVPATALPHIIVALICVTMFSGVVAFNRALTGQAAPLAGLLVLPLLYSWILNWGFVNFLLGLGLAFGAAAFWLRLRDRPLLRLAVAMPAAVLIFLCHGVAFALYGVLIGSLELGHWLQQAQRQPVALARNLAMCAVQAILPWILFRSSRTVSAEGGLTNADETVVRLWNSGGLAEKLQDLLLYRIRTIIRVAEGPSLALDAVWMGAAVVLLAWLWRSRRIGLSAVARPAIAVAALLVIACPPALFGVGAVADRMPLFMALLLVGSVRVAPGLRLDHPAVIGLAALVAARLVSIAVQWQGTAADLADLDRVASHLPPAQLVTGFAAGARPHPDVPQRCDMYLHVMALRHRHIVPLFANRTQQPIAVAGRLEQARSQARAGLAAARATVPAEHVSAKSLEALAGSGFDYILLCQAATDRPRPDTPYPVVAQAGRFSLLDTRRTAPP